MTRQVTIVLRQREDGPWTASVFDSRNPSGIGFTSGEATQAVLHAAQMAGLASTKGALVRLQALEEVISRNASMRRSGK